MGGGIPIKPKVTIVIPVYNVEKYIEKCLESIMNQKDFHRFEVLIINDGTKDQSIALIKDKIASFANITLINQPNGGLSEARNTGIRYAKGDYISFIDSDDWIEPDMISSMAEQADRTGSDIAICKMRKVYEDAFYKPAVMDDGFERETVMSSQQALELYFKHDRIKGYVCNKLFKTSLFQKHGIRFPKGKMYEDIATTFQLIYYAKTVVFLDGVYYNYLQRTTSITQQLNRKVWHLIENVHAIKAFLLKESKYAAYKEHFNGLLIAQLFIVHIHLQKNKKSPDYRLLKQKLETELDQLSYRDILTTFKIQRTAKLKYAAMKMRADAAIDVLLYAKAYKERKKAG